MAVTTRQSPARPVRRPVGSVAAKAAARAVVPPKRTPAPRVASGFSGGYHGTPAFTIFHYGPSGVGKTSMWAYAPKPGFIYDPQEEGIRDLYQSGQVPKPAWECEVPDFDGAMTKLAEVANKEHPIEFLIIDSATGFEKLCFHKHCAEQFNNDWSKDGFLAYGHGPKSAAKTDWPDFLNAIDQVRRAGIPVVFIGHSDVKPFQNPDGPDFDQYRPDMDKATWGATHRWAKAVLFHNIEIGVEKAKGSSKYKAQPGSEVRMMYTTPGSSYSAKNRWGLPASFELGTSPKESYEAFKKAYLSAWKKGPKC